MEIRIFPSLDMERDGNLIGQIRPCEINKQQSNYGEITGMDEQSGQMIAIDTLNAEPQDEIYDTTNNQKTILFPNPTLVGEQVKIQGTQAGDCIQLLDFYGTTISEWTILDTDRNQIFPQTLPAGAYLVLLKRGGEIVAKHQLIYLN